MARWGNALGGWRKQPRAKDGTFGHGRGGSAKKVAKKTVKKPAKKPAKKRSSVTRSTKNGTTYETTRRKGLLGGTTVTTKAYRGREFRGYAESHVGRKSSSIENIFVEKAHRGTGISTQMISIQGEHLKSYKKPISVTGDRSVGGQKLVERNSLKGVSVKKRSNDMSSAEITGVVEVFGRGEKRAHEKAYDKARSKKTGMSRQKKAAIAAGVVVAGAAAYAAHSYLKESGLKEKHGSAYMPKTITAYHYTYGNSGRKILKGQSMVSKQRYGLPGTSTGVWFTNSPTDNRASMEIQYGENVLKTKVKRKHVQRHIQPYSNKDHHWMMVDKKNVGVRAGRIIKPYRTQTIDPIVKARARNYSAARKRQGSGVVL